MILRSGRYGKFYGCAKFPYCKGTKNYVKGQVAGAINESWIIMGFSHRFPPKSKADKQEHKRIVTHIEKEQEAVESAKNLINIPKQKTKDKIAEVWGEWLTS